MFLQHFTHICEKEVNSHPRTKILFDKFSFKQNHFSNKELKNVTRKYRIKYT